MCTRVHTLTYANSMSTTFLFLADRSNGRAYATVLRPSVGRLSVTYVLWLNGAT